MPRLRFGQLAKESGYSLPVQVLESSAGFYLGTADEEGPVSRESSEYFASLREAQAAMQSGDWTQRDVA